jgi:hypothetical protein
MTWIRSDRLNSRKLQNLFKRHKMNMNNICLKTFLECKDLILLLMSTGCCHQRKDGRVISTYIFITNRKTIKSQINKLALYYNLTTI